MLTPRHPVARWTPMLALLVSLGVTASFAAKPSPPQNGTTLAAVKTLDICDAGSGYWIYSGEVAVWNQGAVDTQGFAIQDCIQNKEGAGKFLDVFCNDLTVTEIPAGTTQETALTFSYSFLSAALSGDIRNIARCTILNHSGHITDPPTPFGPEPKATWLGDVPPPCGSSNCGCTLTQGFWGTHPDDWPPGHSPSDPFFLSGQTWQQVLDTPAHGNGYYILAYQYIAAVLNAANGTCVPSGVQDLVDQATAWFEANGPDTCGTPGSCGVQKDWGAVLDDYNNGIYPGGPPHCN